MPYVGGAWSSPESDLEPGPFCSVCLIDMNPPGAEKVKEKCYLPIRKKPGGPIYISAIRAALGQCDSGGTGRAWTLAGTGGLGREEAGCGQSASTPRRRGRD
jgi:hypothetical protein